MLYGGLKKKTFALPKLEWDATEDALTAFNPQAKLLAKLDATDEALQADAAQLL